MNLFHACAIGFALAALIALPAAAPPGGRRTVAHEDDEAPELLPSSCSKNGVGLTSIRYCQTTPKLT